MRLRQDNVYGKKSEVILGKKSTIWDALFETWKSGKQDEYITIHVAISLIGSISNQDTFHKAAIQLSGPRGMVVLLISWRHGARDYPDHPWSSSSTRYQPISVAM